MCVRERERERVRERKREKERYTQRLTERTHTQIDTLRDTRIDKHSIRNQHQTFGRTRDFVGAGALFSNKHCD